MATRITIYLDTELLVRARRFVPPRGLSRLVTDLLTERIAQLEQAELEAQMREGYLAVKDERRAFNTDWAIVDGENWLA